MAEPRKTSRCDERYSSPAPQDIAPQAIQRDSYSKFHTLHSTFVHFHHRIVNYISKLAEICVTEFMRALSKGMTS